MDLSIIIVNWNCAAYTRECIASVLATTQGLDYEIIVVDNASTDDSCEILARGFDRTELVFSPANVGFARGNNVGFERAHGRAVLFLNPDTVVLGDAILRMFAALEMTPRLGAVGCRLLNRDGTLQTSCVQPFPTITNQVVDIDWLRRRLPRLGVWGMTPLFVSGDSRPAEVEAVSGACLMTRRAVFEQVGRFSTDYFMYTEDIDLCFKIWRAGFGVGHVTEAEVVHYGGGSSRRAADGFADVVMRDSIQRFLCKTRGTRYAAAYRRSVQVVSLLRIFLLLGALGLPLERAGVRASLTKWRRIRRWSRGLEPWTAALVAPSDALTVT